MEMELKSFLQEDHGLIFWAAFTVMAIGVSLLVAVGFVQLRRVVPKFGSLGILKWNRQRQPLSLKPPIHRSGRATRPPDSARSAPPKASIASTRQTPQPEPLNGSLPVLLRRLQSAADRLEKMADDLSGSSVHDSESSLKQLPGEVEYVFKASRH